MTTIRTLAKKITTLVLDTNLELVGKFLLKWVLAPCMVILSLSFIYMAYEHHRDLTYCSDRGVSEAQCSDFIEYTGY